MALNINLKELSQISTQDKTFLSIYIRGKNSLKNLEKNLNKIRKGLQGKDTEKDEKEHFEENVKAVKKYLAKNPLRFGSICLFSCWGLDFFKAFPLKRPVKDLIWYDSSPYIRPLAELLDEYENVAVVVADNKKSRIFLVSLAVSGPGTTIEGNIKNHVKKGGWSQQRYERRRDKQLLSYSREIVNALMELGKKEDFSRIVLVGSREILEVLDNNLPKRFKEMVKQRAVDLGKGENLINHDIMELFQEQERLAEHELWEKIRAEYLRSGLGIIGLADVLEAVKSGRGESIILNRNLQVSGTRCRECENLEQGDFKLCPKCGATSCFTVDLINEIVELADKSGATVDFCDPVKSLDEAGGIAAFLRYKL